MKYQLYHFRLEIITPQIWGILILSSFLNSGCLNKIDEAKNARYGSVASTSKSVGQAPASNLPTIPPASLGSQSVPIFTATLFPLVVTNCNRCHGANQFPLFAVNQAQSSHDSIVGSGLVDLTTPSNSRLVQKLNLGHQGMNATLGTQFTVAIQAWSDQLKQSGGNIPAPPKLEAKFSSISALILQPKCVSCHGPTLARDGVRYDTHSATLRTVNLNNPTQSKFYTSVIDGSMPPKLPLSDEEEMIILEWIKLGAPNN